MGILSKIGAVLLKVKGAVMATTATKAAAAAVAVTIVVGSTIGVVQTEVFAAPETRVENALDSLLENEEGTFSKELGWKAFFKALVKDGVDAGFQIKLEDVPMDELGLSGITIPNIGVEFHYRFDAKTSQMQLTAGAKVADTTLISADVYADKEKAAASVPQLFEGYIGAEYAESEFVEKLKNSELATMLGEDFSTTLETLADSLKETETSKEALKLATDYVVALKESKDALFASMEAEKAEDAEVVVDGETVKCKVYTATFGQEEVEAFLIALIDETAAFYDAYMEENAESLDEETRAEMTASADEMIAEMEFLKEELKGAIADTNLKIYLKGKRLVQANLQFTLEGTVVELNVLFGLEGNRYDNMNLAVNLIEDGETIQFFALTHVTENTEELLSSEWTLIVGEEELIEFICSYEKVEGDFYFGLLLPTEEMALEFEGVLTIPNKGKELAFELNDISYTEYGEKVSFGFKMDISLKVLDSEITAPEEIKWDVVSMTAGDWEEIVSEITGNVYKVVMGLLFSN